MKQIFLLLLLCFMQVPHALAESISAECACVMVAKTGEVIFEKNAYREHGMASTTKIMTALLALESGTTDDIVTISKLAEGQEGSSIYLRAGEKIRMMDLLYGLMLNSGNDAAVAIAEHLSGDVASFSEQMTQRAFELGAVNTRFQNPNGLDAPEHYTTAYDLALIASTAIENPEFRKIVSTRQATATLENGHILYFSNHNKLLSQYDGAIGIKTGFTKRIGRCLVSAAERDGVLLVGVTLNAPDDWNDHTKLLDKGFSEVSMKTILPEGYIFSGIRQKNQTVGLVSAEAVRIPMKTNGSIEIIPHLPERLPLPLNIGDKVGEAEILRDGKKIATVSIISDSVSPDSLPQKSRTFPAFLLQFLKRYIFGR